MMPRQLRWSPVVCVMAAAVAIKVEPSPQPFPPVERMSAAQLAALAELRDAAEAASARATPRLTAVLDAPDFRERLRRCCARSGVAAWPTERLLQLLRAELQAAELVHNFDGSGHTGMNLEIALHNATEYFPNPWELLRLGYFGDPENASYGHPAVPADASEEGVFRLRPFHGDHDLPSTFEEASWRLQYAALNALRIDVGNPAFGHIAAVFSASYWDDAVAVAPIDSGTWTMCCNETYRRTPGALNVDCSLLFSPLHCDKGDITPGVAGALDHAILNHHVFWRDSDRLGRLFEVWYGDEPANISLAESLGFMESDILGSILYGDRGIKLLVGSFGPLFGSERGALLRQVARERGIALAWAIGPGVESTGDFLPTKDLHWRPDVRLLDPTTTDLGLVNASVQGSSFDAFSELWAETAAARVAGPLPRPRLEELWQAARRALGPGMRLRLPAAGECDDWHACLGRSGLDDCVCYASGQSIIVA